MKNKKIYTIVCYTKEQEFKGYFIENQFTDYKKDKIIGITIENFRPVKDEAKIYTHLSDAIDDLHSLSKLDTNLKMEIFEYEFQQKFN